MIEVIIKKSHRPDKKLDAVVDGRKTIPFGAKGMSDYTIHKDDARKQRYINRHRGMGEDWGNPLTAGFYALWVLWNKKP